MSKPRPFLLLAAFAVLLGVILPGPTALGQSCVPISGGVATAMPQYSGSLPGLTYTGQTGNFLYVVTEWGVARFSLANPAAPSGGNVGMIGLDWSQGSAPN